MSFTFNRNYDDLQQVAEFYPAYLAVYDELAAAGKYPYNDSFKGRIPGLAGSTSKDEDSAIYLLQKQHDVNEMNAELDAWREKGAVDLVHLDGERRFATLIEYGFYMGGTGIRVRHEVRVRPDDSGRPAFVLAKRQRSASTLGRNLLGIAA